VVVLSRRPIEVAHQKLVVAEVDFARLEDRTPPAATAALCALGTTIKRAGSQRAFRAVDHDAVVAFARWARRAGSRTFALVSSVGADPAARTFYLRVKGEAEEAVAALGFPRFVALRPSLLLGHRTASRPAEAVARGLMPLIAPILAGSLRRYRPISADIVAAALVAAARSDEPGRLVWEHDDIVARAATPSDRT
jgi:uncharacterized protein YbjT (DUF2867 family)